MEVNERCIQHKKALKYIDHTGSVRQADIVICGQLIINSLTSSQHLKAPASLQQWPFWDSEFGVAMVLGVGGH